MGERPSEYERDVNDWYVEPAWCVQALKDRVRFTGGIHDPCCGSGTIPRVMNGTGSDLIDRNFGYPVSDFLTSDDMHDNIVMNPPYKLAQEFIEEALDRTRYKVAALVQVKFLASQRRFRLFTRLETSRVIMFSRRPSMPPGGMLQKHGESIRGGGSIDYCWVVWEMANKEPCRIEWMK